MTRRQTPAARKIAFRVLIAVVAIGDVVLMAWLAGWQGVAIVLSPILLLFGPTVMATRTGRGSLGKREDGSRGWGPWLLFAPYLVTARVLFDLMRLLSREPAFAEVAPALTFGRRLTEREARRTDFVAVLDLAAEFSEVQGFRELPGYCSLPVFDTHPPTPEQLRCAVGWLTEAVARGPVYVHCALGHGRSACVVLAFLLATGAVATYADGLKLLRKTRPKARLNPAQREAVRAFEPASSADGR